MRLAALLTGVTFVDELAVGVPMLGAPDIESAFSLSHQATALLLFVVPLGLAVVLEPLLLLAASRRRKPFLVGSLVVFAGAQLVAGLSPSLPVAAVALALLPTASGVACGVGQATMVDAAPRRREQWMTRWTLLGAGGDLAAPVLFVLFGGDWRLGFLASGAIAAVYAGVVARRPVPRAVGDEGRRRRAPSWRRELREALRSPRLLLWLAAVSLCSLLDEILVAFGGLHLRDALGAGPPARAVVLSAFAVGAIAGLVLTERLLEHVPPRRLLAVSCVACAVAYLGWLATPSLVASAALLGLVGLFAAPLYPIAKAQAYAALPGRGTTVNAVGQLFAPAEIAAPYLLAAVVDSWGLEPALLLLILQPVGILAVLAVTRSPASTTATSRE